MPRFLPPCRARLQGWPKLAAQQKAIQSAAGFVHRKGEPVWWQRSSLGQLGQTAARLQDEAQVRHRRLAGKQLTRRPPCPVQNAGGDTLTSKIIPLGLSGVATVLLVPGLFSMCARLPRRPGTPACSLRLPDPLIDPAVAHLAHPAACPLPPPPAGTSASVSDTFIYQVQMGCTSRRASSELGPACLCLCCAGHV